MIGLDSEPVRTEHEEYLLIHRHYARLKDHPIFKQSKFIFIPENNLGMEHHHLEAMVQDIDGVETFWETDKKPGVFKGDKATREYQFLLTNCLAQGGLRYDRDLFTVSRGRDAQSVMDVLQDQMNRYHWETKKSNDAMGKDRYKLTGKIGNQQDDLLIAVAMVIYVGRLIIRDPARLEVKYRPF